MMQDDLEFRIAQYADGTLSAAEAVEVRRHLAEDPDGRALFEAYAKLDGALNALPLPEVRWEALAERISQAAAVQADRGAPEAAQEAPDRTYTMPWAGRGSVALGFINPTLRPGMR